MRNSIGPILLILIVAIGVRLEARRTPAVLTDTGVQFIDPDDYMRLYRVREILEGRDQRVDTIPHINWPQGGELHWTLPTDYFIVGAVRVLGPLVGDDPQQRIDRIAAWLPVAMGALYLAIFMQLLARGCGWPIALLAGATVAVLPAFHRPFALGHPDHHTLLELCILLAVLLWLPARRPDGDRAIPSGSAVLLSGAATGLAIWVSPQAWVFHLAILTGATFSTFHAGMPDRARWVHRRFEWNCAVFFVVAIGHLLENWPQVTAASADRISAFHVAIAMLAFLVPSGAFGPHAVGDRKLPEPAKQSALSWILAVCGLLMLGVWVFVQQAQVFRHVRGDSMTRWFAHLSEFQPLWTRAGGEFSLAEMHRYLGFFPYFLPVAILLFIRNKLMPCGLKLTLTLLAIAVTLLAICQRRWLDHVSVGLICITVVGLWRITERSTQDKGAPSASMRQTVLTAVGLLLLLAPTWRYVVGPANLEPDAFTARAELAAKAILSHASRDEATTAAPRGILSDDGQGPILLYRTRLPIVAGPYHRLMDGILEMAKFYAERDTEAARNRLARLDVKYVVVPYRPHDYLMNCEQIAFGELRSYDPPIETLDAHGLLHLELRYRPEIVQTMAYRLAMEPDEPPAGLECIARIREGAQTADGYSGLVYVVQDPLPPRPESEF